MKFLFLLLVSLNAFAGGFVGVDKINACDRTVYTSSAACSQATGGNCYETPDSGECGIYDLVDDENGGKKIVIDQAKLSQRTAQKAQSAQYEGALAFARRLRECGGRVMDLMLVRNQPKGLTSEQVKSLVATYAPIQGLLSSGSLVSAKEEIAEVSADGVLVTESDKAALTAEINKCLGL